MWWIVGVVVLGLCIAHPALGVLLLVGIIAWIVLTIYQVSCWRKKSRENSQGAINLAVSYIEKLHSVACKHQYIEPSVLTMYKRTNENDNLIGFYIVLYTNLKYQSDFKYVCDELWSCDLEVDEDGDYSLNMHGLARIDISWEKFNSEVWLEIKRKHPDWKVNYVRPDKSAIWFNF